MDRGGVIHPAQAPGRHALLAGFQDDDSDGLPGVDQLLNDLLDSLLYDVQLERDNLGLFVLDFE
jgi:hypothetical protein